MQQLVVVVVVREYYKLSAPIVLQTKFPLGVTLRTSEKPQWMAKLS